MELPEQLISGYVHELKLLEQLLGQLLSETVQYLELSGQSSFRGLCYLKIGSYYRRVQLIDLVTTLQHRAIIASLTGWRSTLCTQSFTRYCLLWFITSGIDAMEVSLSIQLIGTRS